MPYPGLLHPHPLPLQQATADRYLHRRHSNTILAQTLWGLWFLVHTATASSRRLSWRGGRVCQQEPYFRPHSRSWCWRLVSSLVATPGHTWPHLTSWTKCLRLDALASNSLLKATEHSVPVSGHYVPSLFAFCTQVPVPTACPSSK